MTTIPTVRLDEKAVSDAIMGTPNSAQALEQVYKLVYPNWEQVLQVDGFPACNEWTWRNICEWFISRDKAYNATLSSGTSPVFEGGIWMNCGFSVAASNVYLDNWEILPAKTILKT